MESKKVLNLRRMILIALFSALCYVALMLFKIPVPSPVGTPFIHMGNMFVILAALLFSGTIGGLSGSIGMGLYDVLNGYAHSALKTVVLKFGIGFITGIVAAKGHKEDAKSPILPMAIVSAFFILLGTGLMAASLTYGYEFTIPYLTEAAEHIDKIKDSVTIIPVLYIFALIIGVGLAVTCVFAKKVSIKMQYAILGAVCGILFNLFGEFIYAFVTLILLGSGIAPALMSALISLPSTILNGTISIVIAIILYVPLSKALARMHYTV